MKNKQGLMLVYGVVVGIASFFVITLMARYWMDSQRQHLAQIISEKVSDQERKVSNTSALIASTDSQVNLFFKDCSTRIRFDTLLDKLSSTISHAELEELSAMYDSCANFYPNRRAVMTLRFGREVELLKEYVEIKKTFTKNDDEAQDSRVAIWYSILDAEIEIAKQFKLQAEVQRSIIQHLKAGKNERSAEIVESLDQAKEIAKQITFQLGMIEKYRLQLN